MTNKYLQKISLAGLLVLMGCEVGPDYESPKIEMPVLKTQNEALKFLREEWWRVFKDPVLADFERRAIENNLDLKKAIANVDEARALAGISKADFFPSLNAGAQGAKKVNSQNSALPLSRVTKDFIGTAEASYEIDFFGKYRRANEAARATLLASRAAKDAVLLAVTSEVAKTYFAIRALHAKLAIARRTLKSREESYLVYKSRFKNGYCTELEYLRLEAEKDSVKTTVLSLEAALSKLETALSLLIGENPRQMMEMKTDYNAAVDKIRISTEVPSNIPSDFLMRRPDIIQAEGVLMAANAKIGEAMAAHFPSISLTSNVGFESDLLGNLTKRGSDFFSLSGGIALPIFNGFRIEYTTQAAKARYEGMLAEYKKTVQIAFKEALDAIVANRKNREILNARKAQVKALQKSYALAKKQKEHGLIGLVDLLDVERNLLSAEMELVTALETKLTGVVDLCKALGGGWTRSRLMRTEQRHKSDDPCQKNEASPRKKA